MKQDRARILPIVTVTRGQVYQGRRFFGLIVTVLCHGRLFVSGGLAGTRGWRTAFLKVGVPAPLVARDDIEHAWAFRRTLCEYSVLVNGWESDKWGFPESYVLYVAMSRPRAGQPFSSYENGAHTCLD